MKELNQYETDYPVLANLFGGYFNEDAGYTSPDGPLLSYDEIMSNEVLESYNNDKIKDLVLPEIDRLISENLSEDELDNIIAFFGAGARTMIREQAGVKSNLEWLMDIKSRFLRKVEGSKNDIK